MEELIANGITQRELAETAQYILGVGLVLADDFLAHIGRESLAKIDTKAAYIVRINKPLPAWFFLYGIGITFLPLGGCIKIRSISKTFAEQWALSNMMRELDPNNKYKLRTEYMFIDLKATDGRIVQIPTDEDIVKLHTLCQEVHSTTGAKPKKGVWQPHHQIAKKPMAADVKMRRGLRTIDRRRYSDAGLIPPPSRVAELRKIQAAIEKKLGTDPTIDDSDREEDEDEGEVKWGPENTGKDLLGKILFAIRAKGPSKPLPAPAPAPVEDLFGDYDEPESSSEMMGSGVETNGVARTQHQVQKTALHRPKKTNLQSVLKSMRARNRRQCPRRSDTYLLVPPSSGGGDMED